jgi:hypothetical protein
MLLSSDCYTPFCVSADLKQCKVWSKQSYMLREWSDGLTFGKRTGTAGLLLVSTTALVISPEMSSTESGFDRNVSLHTQLDSSVFKHKAGGTSWPHHPDVVIISVCAHCVTCWTTCSCEVSVDGCRFPDALCVRHATSVVFFGHHRSGKAEAEVTVDSS